MWLVFKFQTSTYYVYIYIYIVKYSTYTHTYAHTSTHTGGCVKIRVWIRLWVQGMDRGFTFFTFCLTAMYIYIYILVNYIWNHGEIIIIYPYIFFFTLAHRCNEAAAKHVKFEAW